MYSDKAPLIASAPQQGYGAPPQQGYGAPPPQQQPYMQAQQPYMPPQQQPVVYQQQPVVYQQQPVVYQQQQPVVYQQQPGVIYQQQPQTTVIYVRLFPPFTRGSYLDLLVPSVGAVARASPLPMGAGW